MIEDISKIYIACPRSNTRGGPESLHQLACKSRELGLDVYIYYYDSKELTSPDKFSMYKIKIAERIQDDSSNLLIVPEIATELLYQYKNIRKCIWWLSLDFYLMRRARHKAHAIADRFKIPIYFEVLILIALIVTGRLDFKMFRFKSDKNKIFHFYNCEYVKEYLIDNGVNEDNIMYLCGPLREEYFGTENNLTGKKDIVAFNPAKGYGFTRKIIDRASELKLDVPFIPIKNMKSSAVVELLKKSKVYIDFGWFPGPERIPREAVMLYCNIVTSTTGSAKNDIDVPIPKECKFDTKYENINMIVDKISTILDNYNDYLPLYEEYRLKVVNQKELFEENIKVCFGKEVN
jgi:hypothetical protein